MDKIRGTYATDTGGAIDGIIVYKKGASSFRITGTQLAGETEVRQIIQSGGSDQYVMAKLWTWAYRKSQEIEWEAVEEGTGKMKKLTNKSR